MRTDLDWLTHLIQCHDQELAALQLLNAYYEGEQPLSYLAPELQAEMGDRIRQVTVNWPRLVVDAVEERLDVEGFRFGDQADADADLWRIWQANNLDEESQQCHLDALVMRRAYVIVGSNPDDETLPVITVESPLEAYAETDPRTRQVTAGIKRWTADDGDGPVDHATLYLPDETVWWIRDGDSWIEDPDNPSDEHGLGEVPMVPLVNRPRTRRRTGVSELQDVIPLSDAACKAATDMMVSEEFHAIPRRYAIGVGQEDFQDERGRPMSAMRKLAGRIWAIDKSKSDGVEFGQFPEANLTNFHATLQQLAEMTAALAGLPLHFLGRLTANPVSADAIRSAEARLVKRAERKQRSWGGSWERVMRLALRFRDGVWDPNAASLETVWRDASTPTIAQAADAATKLYASGIIPKRQLREDLGYTQVAIARMESEDEKAQSAALARVLAGDVASMTGPKPPVAPPEQAAAPPDAAPTMAGAGGDGG